MTPLPSRLALECMDSEPTRAAQNTIDPDRFPADDQRSVGGRDRHDDVFYLFFVLGWLHGRGPLEGEEGCGEYPFTAKTALFLVPARYTRAKLGVHFPPTKDYTDFTCLSWLSWFPGKGQGLGGAAWALAATYTGNAPGRERERDSDEDGVSFSRGSRPFQGVFLGPGLAFVVIETMAAWWVAHRVHIGQLQNIPTKTFFPVRFNVRCR